MFVLTGAGLGVASGLPTFRAPGGLYQGRRAEELASLNGFLADPQMVWEWYNLRLRAYADAEPNAGHRALVALAARVPHFTLATQNVDGLHTRAGSDPIELHGSIRVLRCTGCTARDPLDGPFDLTQLRHTCGGLRRPGVVWFGETLPPEAWTRAERASDEADVVIVAGTSAHVYPAAALARTGEANVTVIEVNPEPALTGTGALVLAVGTEIGLPALAMGVV